ncbi:MAG: fumarylacetoacetate hydrolase family protein [Actinobacteria bacterium]|nr:fumarylacetoacetate hydrolase family protein [Actinomycetota bacterium]
MRLYRYVRGAGGYQPRLAIAVDDGPPIDLLTAWAKTRRDNEHTYFLASTRLFIQEGPDVWAEAESVVRRVGVEDAIPEDARLLCPVDRVPSLRDFLAFENHVKAGAERRGMQVPDYWYEAPIYYKGNHRSLLGPDDECPWPSYTDRMDFELELALIVGKRGRDVSAGDAADHVFGFTVFNDFSARDVQAKEMSAWLGPGKGKDFANAFGPCIVTCSEVGVDPDLEMICRVNGEEWGRARSSEMHWRWGDIIAHVSQDEDIYPGDVYGSGTPGGCCGLDIGRFLNPGDVVELEIENIGVLRNSISFPR